MTKYILLIVICLYFQFSIAQKDAIETSGDVLEVLMPAAAFTSTLIWKDSTKPHWQFIKAFGVSFLVTKGLKRIIDKERPNGRDMAFPSGHTASAFTAAAFAQKRYGWKVGIPAYLLASYVGWTRVNANKHDYLDIVGGIAVGVISSYLFTKPYKKSIKLSTLNFGQDGFSIGFNYQF